MLRIKWMKQREIERFFLLFQEKKKKISNTCTMSEFSWRFSRKKDLRWKKYENFSDSFIFFSFSILFSLSERRERLFLIQHQMSSFYLSCTFLLLIIIPNVHLIILTFFYSKLISLNSGWLFNRINKVTNVWNKMNER